MQTETTKQPKLYRDPATNAVKCIRCEGHVEFDGVDYWCPTCPDPENED